MPTETDLAPESQAYNELYQQYMWLHAIVSILIEQEGGAVQIPKELLENYNLSGSLQIGENQEQSLYTIEVVPVEALDGNA